MLGGGGVGINMGTADEFSPSQLPCCLGAVGGPRHHGPSLIHPAAHLCQEMLAHIPPLMVWWSGMGLLMLHLFKTPPILQPGNESEMGAKACRMGCLKKVEGR